MSGTADNQSTSLLSFPSNGPGEPISTIALPSTQDITSGCTSLPVLDPVHALGSATTPLPHLRPSPGGTTFPQSTPGAMADPTPEARCHPTCFSHRTPREDVWGVKYEIGKDHNYGNFKAAFDLYGFHIIGSVKDGLQSMGGAFSAIQTIHRAGGKYLILSTATSTEAETLRKEGPEKVQDQLRLANLHIYETISLTIAGLWTPRHLFAASPSHPLFEIHHEDALQQSTRRTLASEKIVEEAKRRFSKEFRDFKVEVQSYDCDNNVMVLNIPHIEHAQHFYYIKGFILGGIYYTIRTWNNRKKHGLCHHCLGVHRADSILCPRKDRDPYCGRCAKEGHKMKNCTSTERSCINCMLMNISGFDDHSALQYRSCRHPDVVRMVEGMPAENDTDVPSWTLNFPLPGTTPPIGYMHLASTSSLTSSQTSLPTEPPVSHQNATASTKTDDQARGAKKYGSRHHQNKGTQPVNHRQRASNLSHVGNGTAPRKSVVAPSLSSTSVSKSPNRSISFPSQHIQSHYGHDQVNLQSSMVTNLHDCHDCAAHSSKSSAPGLSQPMNTPSLIPMGSMNTPITNNPYGFNAWNGGALNPSQVPLQFGLLPTQYHTQAQAAMGVNMHGHPPGPTAIGSSPNSVAQNSQPSTANICTASSTQTTSRSESGVSSQVLTGSDAQRTQDVPRDALVTNSRTPSATLSLSSEQEIATNNAPQRSAPASNNFPSIREFNSHTQWPSGPLDILPPSSQTALENARAALPPIPSITAPGPSHEFVLGSDGRPKVGVGISGAGADVSIQARWTRAMKESNEAAVLADIDRAVDRIRVGSEGQPVEVEHVSDSAPETEDTSPAHKRRRIGVRRGVSVPSNASRASKRARQNATS